MITLKWLNIHGKVVKLEKNVKEEDVGASTQ